MTVNNDLASNNKLTNLVIASLEKLKAKDITILDVKDKANFTDVMVIASGTSDRHLKAMADEIYINAKKTGYPPLSIEGKDTRNWILVDLVDVVVHLMHPDVRKIYELEKLWSIGQPKR